MLLPLLSRSKPPGCLTPGQQVAEAWALYLARTRNVPEAEYEMRERREWARLKGRLAALRIDDAERLMAARDHREALRG